MQTEPLVLAKWLAKMVQQKQVGPGLRILDASWFMPEMKRDAKKEFAHSHIPGASFFDIDDCVDKSSKYDHMLPDEKFFSDYVGKLGIGNNCHVVVYDASDFGAFTCTRVWWMFHYFGHPRVSMLDGGFKNWVKEGHPVSGTYTKPEPAHFKATVENPSWAKSYEDIRRNVASQEFQLVDTRTHDRFEGREQEPGEDIPPGHIPGAKCIPFFDFLDADGMMLPPEQLKKVFAKSQVDLSKPLCGTCGSGVTACHMVLAAHVCGVPGVAVYDGSWCEWVTKAPPELIVTKTKSKN